MGNYIPHIKASERLVGVARNLFQSEPKFPLCSRCFVNQGLRLDAEAIGIVNTAKCKSCGSTSGRKLDKDLIATLAHRFFVLGTFFRRDYGAAPIVQFNEHQTTDIRMSDWYEADLRLIERAIGVGFFYYGPRLWMVGEVEPLKALEAKETRNKVLARILKEYPSVTLKPEDLFYRLRVGPSVPENVGEYDSPPKTPEKPGRLDSTDLRVMYGSQDLQVCVHECRVAAADEIFVATLAPKKELQLLDLTELLAEDEVTEFESLDMAVHMLFLAGQHSYDIAREIALSAYKQGFDGLLYPSYFSLLRTGGMPFETLTGISHRQIPSFKDREKAKIIPNIAVFGRPISDQKVEVKCINRLMLSKVEYRYSFGPVGYEPVESEKEQAEPH